MKLMLLAIPGTALLQTTTSCGDVLKQTLLSSGADFLGTTATTLLNQALSSVLGTNSNTTTS